MISSPVENCRRLVNYQLVTGGFNPLVFCSDCSARLDCLGINDKPCQSVPDSGKKGVKMFQSQFPVRITFDRSGEPYLYKIHGVHGQTYGYIQFQNGTVKNDDDINGISIEDVLNVIHHRLEYFQQGNFPCEENKKAMECIEDARRWLDRRTEDRKRRGVEGTLEK